METVDKYIDKQPFPQKEILYMLRKLILNTFPKIFEEIKMGVPWYEGKFYLVSLKDHVNLGFSVLGLPEKYQNKLEGKGKLMKHLKFYKVQDIDEKNIIDIIKVVVRYFKEAHPKKEQLKY